MAQDATGTPTTLGIPKYNPSADAPSGRGFNAAMDYIDALIAARSLPTPSVTGQVAAWNGSNWVAQLLTAANLAAAAAIAPSQLATGSVLELKVAGTTRKVAFGAGTLTWPGGTSGSNQASIAHGLGVVPVTYVAVIEGIGNPDYVYASAAADATNLFLAGWNPVGIQGAGNKTVYWIAIG